MEYALVVVWLLAFLSLSAIAVPITASLFRQLPGKGIGFAPTVALWWFVAVGYWTGHVGFGRATVWIAIGSMVIASVLFGLDHGTLRRGRVALAAGTGRLDRRAVAGSAAVFASAFFLVVAIRGADPAVTAIGGEKFLDYGLLRATLRADSVPIYDVWFAGETLNYYYGGHLAAGLLAMLTGTDPAFAYNLALAGFYACLATGAFELARGVAAGRALDRGVDESLARRHGQIAGAAAAFFVAVGGNVVTAVQVVAGVLPGHIGDGFASIAASGRVSAADLRGGAGEFFYWDASRVIDGTINEFPFFAFLNGDLHAHMMGAPFLLLAAGVASAYWRTPETALRRRRILVFGVVPGIAGTQVVIHTWDVPTIVGILWLALAFAPASPATLLPGGERLASRLSEGIASEPIRVEIVYTGGALVVAGIAGGIGFLLGAPFLLDAASGQQPASLHPADRSSFGGLLYVHGIFVLGFLAYLVGRIGHSHSGNAWPLIAGLLATVVVGVLTGVPAIGVVIPLLALGWAAFRLGRDVGFETALLIGGAGLVGIVEFVYVVEAAGPGRLNTVFKVYYQVWVLWGVAIGVVLAELWNGRRASTGREDVGSDGSDPVAYADVIGARNRYTNADVFARAFVLVLVVLAAPYAGLALADHFDRHDAGTLHATAFADTDHPEEASAIAWLDETATHHDVLLEAPGASRSPEGLAADPSVPGMYDWRSNPASSLTGIPTVAGWAHQVGYRGEDIYYDRVADVDRAYAGSPEERSAVLTTYEVDYVWVGPTEIARYGDLDFSGEGTVVFENDAVRIYRVDGV